MIRKWLTFSILRMINNFTQIQIHLQAQDDDFYEPDPEDEYIDEEPYSNNT